MKQGAVKSPALAAALAVTADWPGDDELLPLLGTGTVVVGRLEDGLEIVSRSTVGDPLDAIVFAAIGPHLPSLLAFGLRECRKRLAEAR